MAKRPKTSGLRSGTKTPVSGQYRRVGSRGGESGAEVTSTKGNPLPPAKKGETFRLIDKTKHRKS